jgi:L-iditol 2-dehydrogenase
VQLARLAGATSVILSTRQAARRELALQTGATRAVDPGAGSGVAAIRDIAPSGVDVALECAGVPETLNDALAVAKPGGSVVLFGVMAKGRRMSIEPWDLLVREIRLEPAYLNPHTHRRAAEMIAAGALRLDPLISRVVGIEGVPGELGAEPRLGDVKVMVRPGV